MNIDGNFKLLLKDLDIGQLKQKLTKVSDKEWESCTLRQDVFDTAKDTKTIVMKFNGPTQRSNNPAETTTFKEWGKWKSLVKPLISEVQKLYPSSVISKCFFPKLKVGGVISTHTDSGATLELVHRIHIPIITNEDCMFTVGDEDINMKEGYAYEINNAKNHGVVNKGIADRVHLIFDIFCEKEWIK